MPDAVDIRVREALEVDDLSWAQFMDLQVGSQPKCHASGPDKAVCVLNPSHVSDHAGNGYDAWGPKFRCWPRPPAPSRK